jgi:putative nucleotidyltransferase with HDIG domain
MLWNEIKTIYNAMGGGKYMIEEPITQVQHAIQTSLQVKRLGGDEMLQIAGLLHDIGHLIQPVINPTDNVDDSHEIVGTEWLKSRGVDKCITEPIRLHVDAKRYLCNITENYISKLSPASRHTLTLQNGIMSDTEATDFESNPYFKAALILRRADDLGKDISLDSLPSFDSFEKLVNLAIKNE